MIEFVGGVIGFLLLCVWVVTIADLVRRHLGTKVTVAWLLIVVLLPFAGALAYWALRKPSADEVSRRADAEREMSHGAPRPPFDSTRIGR